MNAMQRQSSPGYTFGCKTKPPTLNLPDGSAKGKRGEWRGLHIEAPKLGARLSFKHGRDYFTFQNLLFF